MGTKLGVLLVRDFPQPACAWTTTWFLVEGPLDGDSLK